MNKIMDGTIAEEEILIYVEFDDSIKLHSHNAVHILGIDKNNPIVQIDDTFFTGQYVNPLGTYMFFEEDSPSPRADPLFDKQCETNLKYLSKTQKLLRMEKAYVTPKEDPDFNCEVINNQDSDEIIKIGDFKSIQEAQEAFKLEGIQLGSSSPQKKLKSELDKCEKS